MVQFPLELPQESSWQQQSQLSPLKVTFNKTDKRGRNTLTECKQAQTERMLLQITTGAVWANECISVIKNTVIYIYIDL